MPDPVIGVALLDSGVPQRVQVTIRPGAGEAYEVRGSALGSSWPVPGGVGVGSGSQVVLTDKRSALNTPVTYSVLLAGVTYTAAPVTVALPGEQAVIQSLDGQTSVRFRWLPNGLPLEPTVRAHASDVPGRDRPPVRYATGGDGGGSLSIRTTREGTEAMRALLRAGRPVVIRTDGALIDFPAVELALITAAPSRTAWDVVGMPADRVWSLSYLLVDDPDPTVALAGYTWDQWDAIMAGRTWAQHDAIVSGWTWDQWDATDWVDYA